MAAFQAGWLGHQDKPVLMRPWPWPLGCAWEMTKATNALGDVCFFQRKSRLPNPRSPGSQLRPWRSLGGLLLRGLGACLACRTVGKLDAAEEASRGVGLLM